MTALLIFASGFILVYLLGLQSLNVNGGHYGAAFATSFGIGLSNLLLYKTVPEADLLQMSAFVLSGPLAILAAMWSHAWFKRRLQRPRQIVSIHEWAAADQALQKARQFRLANIDWRRSAGPITAARYPAASTVVVRGFNLTEKREFPMKEAIELGDRVRDPVTGFSGIAISICTFLHGCIRIGVQPEKLSDAKIVESQYFDQVQLELVKKTVHVPQVLTVGPKPAPETRRSNGGPAREGAGFRRS